MAALQLFCEGFAKLRLMQMARPPALRSIQSFIVSR